jgi:hypothetical protein
MMLEELFKKWRLNKTLFAGLMQLHKSTLSVKINKEQNSWNLTKNEYFKLIFLLKDLRKDIDKVVGYSPIESEDYETYAERRFNHFDNKVKKIERRQNNLFWITGISIVAILMTITAVLLFKQIYY